MPFNRIDPVLVTIYVTLMITSLILTPEIINIGSLVYSGCLLTFPLLYVLSCIVAEIYGWRSANNLMWTSLSCTFIFALFMNLVGIFFLNKVDVYSISFNHIFGQDIKFVVAGILAIGIGGWVNTFCLSKLKVIMLGKHFFLRIFFATTLGEFVNSFIAFPLGFLGNLPTHEIVRLALTSFFIKELYTILSIYPANLYKQYLRSRGEKAPSSFNPKFIFEEEII